MDPNNLYQNLAFLLIVTLVLLIHGPSSSFADNYADCGKPFNCGSNIQNISYPFWGSDRPEQCGHPKFELRCADGVTEISINTEAYRVLEINQDTRTLLAVRADYFGDVCKTELRNATLLDTTVFNYTSDTQPLTLFYICDSVATSILPHFNCSESGGSNTVNFCSVENLSETPGNIPSGLGTCEGSVVLNISQTQATTLRNPATASTETLIKAVDAGFGLVWNANDSLCDGCESNGNRCGYNRGSEEFVCYQNQNSTGSNNKLSVGEGIAVGAGGLAVIIIGLCICFFLQRRKKRTMVAKEEEEDYLDHVPGMPERFSFEDLKAMTQNFHNKLGEGGFGIVFEGTLSNGMKVAVKRLDGLRQIKKSFLAEVATIGSIHHVNLVRMIGFCVEKSHRLLVYQYMRNGSLDKWIFHKTYELLLSWQQRKKIILDIAKGLSYLHEDCRQKIIHLDIKPENILLDEDFNGKLSDFGLSKLIERDQSQVVTTMRGTPGYLAPEWLGSAITEKVDVYSFGIVIMEIVCGRRNVDRSQPEEAMHLLALFKQKCEENQLVGLIDKCCVDMRSHEVEVVNMMKVAAWCLQSDFVKRPSMSMVVKVLEGVMDIEHNMDYDFTEAQFGHREENRDDVATSLLPSVLSQPR
ncbi:G-type lectin S-receptor-like serine/threonine-protein kinase SD2-5 isoform X2 [Ziziphus jujuba]|uniref:non-specific serine/threonine protein kinase n=1 Tax=Ziziphus jujuba TaxID=326968 RepID=A0ABM4A830_ZIZJJ|nr:G-type lectin S-receptor-like serine/threonine-protein kinase SD2-5 isoform X2 [Ziziphus jujuba]